MNSSLTAITHGLKQVKAGQINQLSIKELSLIFYLIIESNNSHHYKETLQLILLKLLPLDESYDILKKCFSKTESGIGRLNYMNFKISISMLKLSYSFPFLYLSSMFYRL